MAEVHHINTLSPAKLQLINGRDYDSIIHVLAVRYEDHTLPRSESPVEEGRFLVDFRVAASCNSEDPKFDYIFHITLDAKSFSAQCNEITSSEGQPTPQSEEIVSRMISQLLIPFQLDCVRGGILWDGFRGHKEYKYMSRGWLRDEKDLVKAILDFLCYMRATTRSTVDSFPIKVAVSIEKEILFSSQDEFLAWVASFHEHNVEEPNPLQWRIYTNINDDHPNPSSSSNDHQQLVQEEEMHIDYHDNQQLHDDEEIDLNQEPPPSSSTTDSSPIGGAFIDGMEFSSTVRSIPACRSYVEIQLGNLVVDHDDEITTRESCSICLEAFEGGNQIIRMPCSHEFHRDCALSWLEQGHTCPLCRFQLLACDNFYLTECLVLHSNPHNVNYRTRSLCRSCRSSREL